jgi:hypothetical protein
MAPRSGTRRGTIGSTAGHRVPFGNDEHAPILDSGDGCIVQTTVLYTFKG